MSDGNVVADVADVAAPVERPDIHPFLRGLADSGLAKQCEDFVFAVLPALHAEIADEAPLGVVLVGRDLDGRLHAQGFEQIEQKHAEGMRGAFVAALPAHVRRHLACGGHRPHGQIEQHRLAFAHLVDKHHGSVACLSQRFGRGRLDARIGHWQSLVFGIGREQRQLDAVNFAVNGHGLGQLRLGREGAPDAEEIVEDGRLAARIVRSAMLVVEAGPEVGNDRAAVLDKTANGRRRLPRHGERRGQDQHLGLTALPFARADAAVADIVVLHGQVVNGRAPGQMHPAIRPVGFERRTFLALEPVRCLAVEHGDAIGLHFVLEQQVAESLANEPGILDKLLDGGHAAGQVGLLEALPCAHG